MYLHLLIWFVGYKVVTGQTDTAALIMPNSGRCGENTELTCQHTAATCQGWGYVKDGITVYSHVTGSSSKYNGSSERLVIMNTELSDAGNYICYCFTAFSAAVELKYECKPKDIIQLVTSAKKLSLTVDLVYPEPTQMSVTLNTKLLGSYTCIPSPTLSSHYSCTWTSSSSLEDVDGGYRVFVTTNVSQTPLSGNIRIATPGPPSITNREQISGNRWVIHASEDSQVTLTCVSSGGIPGPTVAWYRDSISTSPLKSSSTGVIQADGTYTVTLTHTIPASRSDDLSTFVCRSYYPQATSTVTQGSRETTVLIYLNLRPSQPIITQTNTPVSNGTVTLQCTTSGGRPLPTVTWTYRGQTFSPQMQSVNEDSTLDPTTETYSVVATLQRPVKAADNGEQATCHVNHVTLTAARTDHIDVNVKFPVSPGYTTIYGNSQIIATGSNPLNLNCTTGSSNPASTITWRRGSTVITNSNPVHSWTGTNRGKVTSQILRLTPTRDNDGDMITCSVTNSDSDVAVIQGGAEIHSVALNLTYSPEIQPITSLTVDEGQVGIVLPCIVSSKPVSIITWYHGGSSLGQGQGTPAGGGLNSFNHTLTTVSRDDQGTYRCRADNNIGFADNEDMVVTVRYVMVTAINTTTDSSSTTVSCTLNNIAGSYDSRPWVQKWQQNIGTYVEVNSRPFSATLDLTQLTYQHSGVYICMVKAKESGAIYVQGNTSLLVKAPPVILEPKTNQTRYRLAGRLNHNATVSVQYYSNVPGSDVKCHRSNNGTRSSTTVGYITQSEMTVQLPVFSHTVPTLGTMATVTILVSKQDDFGDYDITITNDIGSGSLFPITVLQQAPPDAPTSVQIITYGPNMATLVWLPGNHSDMDQTFVIQLSRDGLTWLNKTSVYGGQDLAVPFSATLGSLTPSTTYFVRTFAYNSEGRSLKYSDVLNFTTDIKSDTFAYCDNSCQGQLAGGMVGGIALGLLVGVVVTLLVQRYTTFRPCIRASSENTSGLLKTSKNLKTRQDHYQNPTFSGDDSQPRDGSSTGKAAGVYEDLKTSPKDSTYASLQTAARSEAAYYNLNI